MALIEQNAQNRLKYLICDGNKKQNLHYEEFVITTLYI